MVSGPDAGARFEADRVSIGTASGNNLVLTDPTVSRCHAELTRLGDRIEVRDLGSTNGTFSGGIGLTRANVLPGTTIEVGESVIRATDGATVTVDLADTESLGGLKGSTSEMRALMARIELLAASDASILVVGETGTGKEVVAETIHRLSPRSQGPFETVDCGVLQPALIASELFGHEKGAFTGADDRREGAFERAHGGTLFLDEIGELPLALQPVLLGALERRKFKRLGGSKEIPVDVRVVSATNRDLRSEVNSNRFRSDVYFRLAVVALELPPLARRQADIPLLIDHFLNELGHEGQRDRYFPPSTLELLKGHRWPGNVRELRNLVEATVATGEAPRIGAAFAPVANAHRAASQNFSFEELLERPYGEARSELLERFEAQYLAELLNRTSGNVSLAARTACMTRSHLNVLVKKHSLR